MKKKKISLYKRILNYLKSLFVKTIVFRSKAEECFYKFIKNNINIKILVNHKLDDSGYELDFYLPKYKIAIELDYHPNHFTEEKVYKEHLRDLYFLYKYDITTIRIVKKQLSNEVKKAQFIEDLNSILYNKRKTFLKKLFLINKPKFNYGLISSRSL